MDFDLWKDFFKEVGKAALEGTGKVAKSLGEEISDGIKSGRYVNSIVKDIKSGKLNKAIDNERHNNDLRTMDSYIDSMRDDD